MEPEPGQRPATRLILVRHGQARASDDTYGTATPLSALGLLQAAAAAARLADCGAVAVYASPLRRALETAQPVAASLGVPVSIVDGLAEVELGGWSPVVAPARDDLLAWLPEHRIAPGGETMRAFTERVEATIEALAARHCGKTAVLVAHEGTIDAVLRWALAIPPDAPWQAEFGLPNASLSEVRVWLDGRVTGGAPRFASIDAVGVTTHLGDLVSQL